MISSSIGLLSICTQMLEQENRNSTGQISLLEDQLKMASIASSRKLQDAQERHRELGVKLQEILTCHENLQSHLAT